MKWNSGMVFSATLEGGAPAPAPAPAPDPVPPPQPATDPAPAPVAPSWKLALGDTRPDNVPEKFWDAEAKALRVDALLESYREGEAWRGKRADAYKAEFERQMREGVPDAPDGYKIELEKMLPEGFAAARLPDNDPLVAEMRAIAHEAGMKPEAWERMVKAFVGYQVRGLPDAQAERAKLGEGAEARIAAVDMWLARTLPEDSYRALESTVNNAAAVKALEDLMRVAGATGRVAAPAVPGGGAAPSQEEAMAAMKHPAYWAKTDEGAALRAKVEAWAKASASA